MEDARCVGLHAAISDRPHVEARLACRTAGCVDRVLGKLFLGTQEMDHDRPLVLQGPEGHIEVARGGEVSHQDPVRDPDGCLSPTVPQERDDVRHPIESHIPEQVPVCNRVHLARKDG